MNKSLLVTANPSNTENNREVEYIDPNNMVLGTTGNYIEINKTTDPPRIEISSPFLGLNTSYETGIYFDANNYLARLYSLSTTIVESEGTLYLGDSQYPTPHVSVNASVDTIVNTKNLEINAQRTHITSATTNEYNDFIIRNNQIYAPANDWVPQLGTKITFTFPRAETLFPITNQPWNDVLIGGTCTKGSAGIVLSEREGSDTKYYILTAVLANDINIPASGGYSATTANFYVVRTVYNDLSQTSNIMGSYQRNPSAGGTTYYTNGTTLYYMVDSISYNTSYDISSSYVNLRYALRWFYSGLTMCKDGIINTYENKFKSWPDILS